MITRYQVANIFFSLATKMSTYDPDLFLNWPPGSAIQGYGFTDPDPKVIFTNPEQL
jgi:hypothetical protein